MPILAMVVLALSANLMGQVNEQPGNPSAIDAEQEQLTINMHEADIGAVIQWVAEKTHKQIVIDPRVRGNITILANQPMSVDQAYQVFLAALDIHGFSAVESKGVLRIFPAALSKTSPGSVLDNYDSVSGGEQVVYVFQASNVSADKLKQLIQPLVPASGYLSAFPDSNSLVIGDDAENVKRLLNLLRQVDSSGDFHIETIALEYAAADKVADLVTSLIGTQSGKAFSIASDTRVNSVLMSGDPATRRRVRQLIKQLDVPLDVSGTTRVVRLNYLSAKEVLPILKGVSDTAQKSEKSSDTASAPISIEASDSANAIVITAPPSLLDLMEKVIKDIDVRRSQVLVEAVIVDVSKEFYEILGVEWNTSFSASDGAEAATSFGLKPDLGNVDEIGSASALLGSGLSLGFFRNGSLRALIRALANESDVNILSTPSILTLDNEEAEVLVGRNVPFITGQSTSGSSSTNNPFTTIERQDIGLTLKITPKINEGDAITLDVLQEFETIAESAQVTSDIVTDKRSIKTKVLVEDNTILVLGGLISDEEQWVEDKVPFLGDIPLVGRLFKSSTKRFMKRNLMVFIHPTIVDSSDMSQQTTKEKYNYLKKLREQAKEGSMEGHDNTLKDFDTYRPTQESQ